MNSSLLSNRKYISPVLRGAIMKTAQAYSYGAGNPQVQGPPQAPVPPPPVVNPNYQPRFNRETLRHHVGDVLASIPGSLGLGGVHSTVRNIMQPQNSSPYYTPGYQTANVAPVLSLQQAQLKPPEVPAVAPPAVPTAPAARTNLSPGARLPAPNTPVAAPQPAKPWSPTANMTFPNQNPRGLTYPEAGPPPVDPRTGQAGWGTFKMPAGAFSGRTGYNIAPARMDTLVKHYISPIDAQGLSPEELRHDIRSGINRARMLADADMQGFRGSMRDIRDNFRTHGMWSFNPYWNAIKHGWKGYRNPVDQHERNELDAAMRKIFHNAGLRSPDELAGTGVMSEQEAAKLMNRARYAIRDKRRGYTGSAHSRAEMREIMKLIHGMQTRVPHDDAEFVRSQGEDPWVAPVNKRPVSRYDAVMDARQRRYEADKLRYGK